MLELTQISPSRIKTYDTCLFKYYLTYVQKAEMKSNWGAANGSLIHTILENYTNKSNTAWLDQLYKGFAGELEFIDKDEMVKMKSPLALAKEKEYQLKKPECDICDYTDFDNNRCGISKEPLDNLTGCPQYLFDKSRSMIEDTIFRYDDIWNRILKINNQLAGIEYEFFIPVRGTEVLMHGLEDLVVVDNEDTVHIYDYKTGVKTQDYNECKEDLQVKMYSLAARREFIDDIHNKGFKFKNVLLTFDYFQDQPVTLAFSKEEDDATEEFVREKILKIQNTSTITRIVPNGVDWNERGKNNSWKHWRCKFLCDTNACEKFWPGADFKV